MRHLSRSQIFKDYECAFSEAMGLPLNIRGRDSWSPSHHGKGDHDSFASILARFNKARAACLRAQTDASREPESDAEEPDQETLREYYSAAPRVGLQGGLEAT
jgi:hypothetical protein